MNPVHNRKPSLKMRLLELVVSLLRPLSVPTELCLHMDTGERYFGFSGFIGIVVLGALCWQSQSWPIWVLGIVYLIKVLVYKNTCEKRRKHGGPIRHSRYPGLPLWGLLREKMAEDDSRQFEWFLVFVLGFLFTFVDHEIACYLIWASGAGAVCAQLRMYVDRNLLLDWVDEEIERREMEKKLEDLHGPAMGGIHRVARLRESTLDGVSRAPNPALPALISYDADPTATK